MKRCTFCRKLKALDQYHSLRKPRAQLSFYEAPPKAKLVGACLSCRAHYKRFNRMTLLQRSKHMRKMPRKGDGYTVKLIMTSGNRKLGRIPVSTTDGASCPSACGLKNRGCYAEQGKTRMHWQEVPKRGVSWFDFCNMVAAFPAGQFWRHNEAGDLPGVDDHLDVSALGRLVESNEHAGAKGFTFTHKPLTTPEEREAVASANARGFTINLSAEGLEHADALAALGIAPVAVVVPNDVVGSKWKTPAGRDVVLCLNESRGLSCVECKLCAAPFRKSIVAFKAHGQSGNIVSEVLRHKRVSAHA